MTAASNAPVSRSGRFSSGKIPKLAIRMCACVAFAGVLIYFSLTARGFTSPFKLTNVVEQSTILGLLAFGMTVVFIGTGTDVKKGGIDLSIGVSVDLSSMIFIMLIAAGYAGIIGAAGGTGLLKSFDGEPSVAFLKNAKELDRTTTFDLIQANPETLELVKPLLPYIDFFVPSVDEAAEMAGVNDLAEAARYFKERGVGNAILTLGGDGVYVDPAKGEPFILPAHDISVIDTTGCGDSFTAGIIIGLTGGWDIRECARFASAVAAKVAMGLGSDGKLISFDDTIEAMHSLPLKG